MDSVKVFYARDKQGGGRRKKEKIWTTFFHVECWDKYTVLAYCAQESEENELIFDNF
jgi:hypothetical protein